MINQDALNRLTIVATQRKLTDGELVEFLQLQVDIALTLAAQPSITGEMRSLNALNANVFKQCKAVLQRLPDLELSLVLMKARRERLAAAEQDQTGRARDVYVSEAALVGEVLALLRARK